MGRIGAGIFDASWVTAEIDGESGEATSRLFFAPVETLPGRGMELAPFELHSGSPGPGFALTESCLTCHTTDDLNRLPGASLFPDVEGAKRALDRARSLRPSLVRNRP